jgi:hypothetical protein
MSRLRFEQVTSPKEVRNVTAWSAQEALKCAEKFCEICQLKVVLNELLEGKLKRGEGAVADAKFLPL